MSHLNLNEKKLRVCITSVIFTDDEKGPHFTPKIFDSENILDQEFELVDIGCATSAAPTYFDPVDIKRKLPNKLVEESKFIDGGVYANNPAGVGFAYAAMKVKSENVRVISIGTGYEDFKIENK